MIPIGACVQGREAVDIGLAWFHCILGDACHTVGGVGNVHAVPVNGDTKGKVIDDIPAGGATTNRNCYRSSSACDSAYKECPEGDLAKGGAWLARKQRCPRCFYTHCCFFSFFRYHYRFSTLPSTDEYL